MGTKRRTTKLDLHLHTPTSDGWGKPRDYVRAIEKAGLDGIVITDHHVTKTRKRPASMEVAKAVRDAGYIALHGCEYSSDDGHILIYGVDVADLDLGMYLPMQEVIWRVRAAGGVAVPSHPYHGYRRKLGDKVFQMEDLVALEGFNGQNQVRAPREDVEAQNAADKLHLPIIANSDAHIAYRVGTCYTEFDGLVRRNGDLVEALLDPSRFRPVVNNRKVAEQKKRGFYSSKSLYLDKIPSSPYRSPSYETNTVSREPVIPEQYGLWGDLQGDQWDDVNHHWWEDEPDIPDHAYRDDDGHDIVSDDYEEVQKLLDDSLRRERRKGRR